MEESGSSEKYRNIITFIFKDDIFPQQTRGFTDSSCISNRNQTDTFVTEQYRATHFQLPFVATPLPLPPPSFISWLKANVIIFWRAWNWRDLAYELELPNDWNFGQLSVKKAITILDYIRFKCIFLGELCQQADNKKIGFNLVWKIFLWAYFIWNRSVDK